jgi:hypothetical protein
MQDSLLEVGWIGGERLHTSRLVSQEQGVALAGFAVDGPHAKGRAVELGRGGSKESAVELAFSRRTGRTVRVVKALEHAAAPEREVVGERVAPWWSWCVGAGGGA